VEEREEEREGVGCKLTDNFDIRTKKIFEIDKWDIY